MNAFVFLLEQAEGSAALRRINALMDTRMLASGIFFFLLWGEFILEGCFWFSVEWGKIGVN